MKLRLLLCLIGTLPLVGCMSTNPLPLPPDDLRREIRENDLVKPGSHVVVTLASGQQLEFTVVDVTSDAMRGRNTSVLIEDILVVEKRRFAPGKTLLVVGGWLTGFVLVAMMLA